MKTAHSVRHLGNTCQVDKDTGNTYTRKSSSSNIGKAISLHTMKSKITTLAASLSLLRLAQPLLLGAFGFATAASTAVVLLQGAAQAQSAISFYNQGIDKLRSRNYQGAIVDFSKAIELNPKFNEAYFNRGDMKVRLKDYQGAIDDFSKAIELDPQNAMAYFNRGSVKGMSKDYQGLCADYKKAASLGNPGERQFINKNYAVKCRNHGT